MLPHREDIKAAIRKEFGSVAAFEREHSLPAKSVTDFFRGRRSERVERAVGSVIGALPHSAPSPKQRNDGRQRKPYPPQRAGGNPQ